MASRELAQADDSSFDQVVLANPSPVMVEFFAPWCGHCRRLRPAIEELARDYAGRLRVVQVNADENRATAARYGVRGVPTMVIFAHGQEIDRVVGSIPKESLETYLDRALAQTPQQA